MRFPHWRFSPAKTCVICGSEYDQVLCPENHKYNVCQDCTSTAGVLEHIRALETKYRKKMPSIIGWFFLSSLERNISFQVWQDMVAEYKVQEAEKRRKKFVGENSHD